MAGAPSCLAPHSMVLWGKVICQCGAFAGLEPMAPRWLISVSGGHHGLVHPQGAGLAHIEHAGSQLSRVEALNDAIHRYGAPEIMNTDQGSQFTSFAWTDRLKQVGTRMSRDGKRRWIDNVYIERL